MFYLTPSFAIYLLILCVFYTPEKWIKVDGKSCIISPCTKRRTKSEFNQIVDFEIRIISVGSRLKERLLLRGILAAKCGKSDRYHPPREHRLKLQFFHWTLYTQFKEIQARNVKKRILKFYIDRQKWGIFEYGAALTHIGM